MDEPKKLKSPILEIWRRLMKRNKKKDTSEEKKEEKQQPTGNT